MGKNWTEHDNPDRLAWSFGWRLTVWIVGIVIVGGVISAGVWAFHVATSEVKGKGDATRQINDGRNQINSQEWFHGQYAQVTAADAKLDGLYDALQEAQDTPDEGFARTNFTGLQNRCIEMREVYNNEAKKISREKWMDERSPVSLGDSDPRTDCQPSRRPTGSPR